MMGAHGLRKTTDGSDTHAYAVLWFDGERIATTDVASDPLMPTWDTAFSVVVPASGAVRLSPG